MARKSYIWIAREEDAHYVKAYTTAKKPELEGDESNFVMCAKGLAQYGIKIKAGEIKRVKVTLEEVK